MPEQCYTSCTLAAVSHSRHICDNPVVVRHSGTGTIRPITMRMLLATRAVQTRAISCWTRSASTLDTSNAGVARSPTALGIVRRRFNVAEVGVFRLLAGS